MALAPRVDLSMTRRKEIAKIEENLYKVRKTYNLSF